MMFLSFLEDKKNNEIGLVFNKFSKILEISTVKNLTDFKVEYFKANFIGVCDKEAMYVIDIIYSDKTGNYYYECWASRCSLAPYLQTSFFSKLVFKNFTNIEIKSLFKKAFKEEIKSPINKDIFDSIIEKSFYEASKYKKLKRKILKFGLCSDLTRKCFLLKNFNKQPLKEDNPLKKGLEVELSELCFFNKKLITNSIDLDIQILISEINELILENEKYLIYILDDLKECDRLFKLYFDKLSVYSIEQLSKDIFTMCDKIYNKINILKENSI